MTNNSIFQAKKALKNILQKCVHLPALEPLLHDAPPNILKHVVAQFSKVRSINNTFKLIANTMHIQMNAPAVYM